MTTPESQNALFHDPHASAFFSTPAHQPDLLLRLKSGMDAAEPSTNGITAQNLYRLSALLEDASYAELARSTLMAFESEILQHPFVFSSMLPCIVWERLGGRAVVVTGHDDDDDDGGEGGKGRVVSEALRKMRREVGVTRTVVRLGGREARSEWLRGRNELLRSMDPHRKGVWVCEGGACREELELGQAA